MNRIAETGAKQIVCVWLPQWGLQRLQQQDPQLRRHPLAVSTHTAGRGARVTMCCGLAVRQGIRVGMTVAEAKALAADLVCSPADADADRSALRALAERCEAFTPTFGPEDSAAPESLLMDVTGCSHLFGDPDQMLSAMTRAFEDRPLVDSGLLNSGLLNCSSVSAGPVSAGPARKGFTVRIGMATTIGAAWAAAHAMAGPQCPATLIDPAELDSLPTASLRISASLIETLTELGLHTVGQLRRIPRSTLPARFGKELQQRLDQLFGLLPETVTPLHLCVPVSAEWNSEEPYCGRQSLRHLIQQLLESLLSQLKPKRQGIRELLFQTRGMSGVLCELMVRMISPCSSLKHLTELLDLQLDKTVLPEDFLFLRLEAVTVESLRVRQRDLFGLDISQTEQDEVHALLNRITSRLGLSSVVRARLVAEVQPELSVVHDPVVAAQPVPAEESSVPLRPLRLFSQQQPIRMVQTGREGSGSGGGGPIHFFWQQQEHRVTRSWGPERIETGWWRGTSVRRDYYGVETQSGCQLWVYCDLDQATWFVHGAFD